MENLNSDNSFENLKSATRSFCDALVLFILNDGTIPQVVLMMEGEFRRAMSAVGSFDMRQRIQLRNFNEFLKGFFN